MIGMEGGLLSSKQLGCTLLFTMAKQEWFDTLHVVGSRAHYAWIAGLPTRIDRIANFGCWSSNEPFALLWILNASEVVVIEFEENNLKALDEQIEILDIKFPKSLQGRTITPICRDMKFHIAELEDEYFDLSFCENVLYSLLIQGGLPAVMQGIEQMIRITKHEGFIVAVEPKYGVDFEKRKLSTLPISIPVPLNEPQNISHLFLSMGLVEYGLPNSPAYSYCYQRGDL